MKSRPIITFESENRKFWSKETRERWKADYTLLAILPEEEGVLYASTMNSSMEEKFEENVCDELEGIEVLKEKGGQKYVNIIWKDGKKRQLSGEQFALLFIAPDNDNVDHDSVVIYNIPRFFAGKVYKHTFKSDKKQGNATAIFWLAKEFF